SGTGGPGPSAFVRAARPDTAACSPGPRGQGRRTPRRARSRRRRALRSSRTGGIPRRRTGSSWRPTIAAGISQRILARLATAGGGAMQRGEPREDERALAALARLHGIQRSYIDTHDRRIRAGREAILATLAALGAPVAGMRDVPGAIRERQRWSWQRSLDPVIVAWDGRLDELT